MGKVDSAIGYSLGKLGSQKYRYQQGDDWLLNELGLEREHRF